MAGVSRFQIAGLRVVNARGAVAAGRGEIRAVAAPGQRHDPVGVLLNHQSLFACGDLVNANGVVRAADREPGAVRAEIHRQRHVRQGSQIRLDRPIRRIEQSHFAELSRRTASGRESRAVRTVIETVRPLGDVFDAAQKFAVSRIPDRDFVVTADRQFISVPAERQRQDGDGVAIDRGRVRIGRFGNERDEGRFGVRSVELRAFLDPTLDQRNLRTGQRIVLLRHPIVFVPRGEAAEKFALVRLARKNRRRLALAAFHQSIERIEPEMAFRFLGTVAGDALFHQYRRNVFAEADRRGIFAFLSEDRKRTQQKSRQNGARMAIHRWC